jgi:predicted SprT family Zn-dependent metalloprotease
MTSPIMPVACSYCKHNLMFKAGLFRLHCDAFPDGIPDDILYGKNKHTSPHPGDNGIMFELKLNTDIIQKQDAQGKCKKGTVSPDSFACTEKEPKKGSNKTANTANDRKIDLFDLKHQFQEISSSFIPELGGFHKTEYKKGNSTLKIISQSKEDNIKLLNVIDSFGDIKLPSQFSIMKMKEPAKYFKKTDTIGISKDLTEDEIKENVLKVFYATGYGIPIQNTDSDIDNSFQGRMVGAEDLKKEMSIEGKRVKINGDGSITFYHGTSNNNADAIRKEGKIFEGSFWSSAQGQLNASGDSGVKWYAKERGKKDGSGGIVLALKLDPRDVSYSSGTQEIYAETELVRDEDGIWKNPKRISSQKQNGMKLNYKCTKGTKNPDTNECLAGEKGSKKDIVKKESKKSFSWSNRTSDKVIDNPFVEGAPSKEKVKNIKEIVDKSKDKYNPTYIKFYHGTDLSIDIENEGLLPTSLNRRRSMQSTSGYVYLANTPKRAKTFGDLGNGGQSTVYEVIVPGWKIEADKDQLNNQRAAGEDVGNSVAESIVYGGGVRVKGKIEPWQVRKYKFEVKQNSRCPKNKVEEGRFLCAPEEDKKEKFTTSSLKFIDVGDGVGRGYQGKITAIDPKTKKEIGYVDYLYENGTWDIGMIEVNEDYKRRGVATALIKKLKESFSEGDKLGMFGNFATKEGKAFMKSVGMGKEKRVPVKGITYNPGLNAVATHISNENIQVGPKFFEEDKESQEYVIAHELAHGVADIATEILSKEEGYAERFDMDTETLTKDIVVNEDKSITRIFAFEQTRLEEAKAEALTDFALDPTHLQEYDSLVYDWAKDTYDAAGIDPEQLKEQANEFVDDLNSQKESFGIKENANDCHEPAGSSNGGQFCSSGDSLENKYKIIGNDNPIRRKNGAEIPLYKSPYKSVDKVLSSINLERTDEVMKKIDKRLSEYNININSVQIAPWSTSMLASYSAKNRRIKISDFMLASNWDNDMKPIGESYFKKYKIYNGAMDLLMLKHNITGEDAVFDHEIGHVILREYNKIRNPKREQDIIDLMEKYSTAKATNASIEELKKFKRKFEREVELASTTPEWKKLIKDEIKNGWRIPTKYGKSAMSECWAECYSLWKNGANELLTPSINEYIDFIDKEMRK